MTLHGWATCTRNCNARRRRKKGNFVKRSRDTSENMVTLTDRQTAMMVADLEKVLRSTKDLKAYNTTRKILLILKKKAEI